MAHVEVEQIRLDFERSNFEEHVREWGRDRIEHKEELYVEREKLRDELEAECQDSREDREERSLLELEKLKMMIYMFSNRWSSVVAPIATNTRSAPRPLRYLCSIYSSSEGAWKPKYCDTVFG